ncbi:MAG: ABC transporter permease [Gemmatimonadaceae bacterium]
MRSVLALLRASALTAASYRVATLLSLVGLLASVVPIYFISDAVGAIAAESIRAEGGNYFGFVVLGIALTYIVASATAALPAALSGSIGNGTLESLLLTRASLAEILIGLAAFPLVQSLLRSALLLLGAALFGVDVHWLHLPAVTAIVLLMIVAYGAIGLGAGALVLMFRTSGPWVTAVVAASGLLGGVYYATSVIPGWLQSLSSLVPLTYALRASRRLLLADAAVTDVLSDVGRLGALAAALLLLFGTGFAFALRRAQRSGLLSQY